MWIGNVFHLIKPFVLLITGIFLVIKFSKIQSNRWRTALALFLMYLFSFLYYSMSSYSSKNPSKVSDLTVLSYNLFFKNSNKSQAIQLLNEQKPTVICLQEVTPAWNKELAQHLIGYPYQLELPRNGTHGFSIYSKFPIKPKKLVKNNAGLPIAQIAEININNKKILIYNTHLASPAVAVENPEKFFYHWQENYSERKNQLNQICKLGLELDPHCNAQILTGDLNTMWFEPIFKELETQWENTQNSFSQTSSFTFPHTHRIPAFLKLDYMFMRGEIDSYNFQVIENGSSDHLAISCGFSI